MSRSPRPRYGFPRTLSALVVGVLAGGVIAAGCSGKSVSVNTSDRLNTGKAERDIGKSASKQVGERVTVACPSDVKLEMGRETICHATDAHGRTQRLRMRQTDGSGHTSWTLIRDLETHKLEPGIVRIGKEKGLAISAVRCPPDIEIVSGTKFACKVAIGSVTADLPALETDDQGDIEFDWNALKRARDAAAPHATTATT